MRILVVEDDPLLGDALQAGLRQRRTRFTDPLAKLAVGNPLVGAADLGTEQWVPRKVVQAVVDHLD